MNEALDQLWSHDMSDRERLVLAERRTKTLDAIGTEIGVTRERVRQIELKARKHLRARLNEIAGQTEQVVAELRASLVIDDARVEDLLRTTVDEGWGVLAVAFGMTEARAWGTKLDGWWTYDVDRLETDLRSLTTSAPFPDSELQRRAEELGLPTHFPISDVSERDGSPIRFYAPTNVWVRRTRNHRDAAYLWLLDAGEAKDPQLMADAFGITLHALRENLRRDDRFVQQRPSGLWALSEWDLPGTKYRTALEAIVDMLENQGPLQYDEIERQMATAYPVTSWRVAQCLTSELLGRMPDGRIGLVSDGATLIPPEVPSRPPTVAVSDDGHLIATRLLVDREMLRGSGLPLPRYVGWRLGLHHAPASRVFTVPDSTEVVTVTKQLGMVQVSSLRNHASVTGAGEGCTIALMLRTSDDQAWTRHICNPGTCGDNNDP